MDNRGESQGQLEQISFGLNYRPVEDAVFKISYQYLPKSFNPNTGERIHDSAVGYFSRNVFLTRGRAIPLNREESPEIRRSRVCCVDLTYSNDDHFLDLCRLCHLERRPGAKLCVRL